MSAAIPPASVFGVGISLSREAAASDEGGASSAAAPIPLLRLSEVVAERELGSGGFCTVWAVRRIEVDLPPIERDQGHEETPPQVARRRLSRRFASYEKKHFSYRHVPGRPPLPTEPFDQKPPKVALKMVRTSLAKERYETGSRDLAAEVSVLAQCAHPNIIPLYAIGQNNEGDGNAGRITFAVIGQLRSTLKNKVYKWREDRGLGVFITRRALNQLWIERLVCLKSVADALKYLHGKGIVHRDVSLDNIGFDADDIVKLFDFGLARCLGESSDAPSYTSSAASIASIATISTGTEMSSSTVREDDLFDLTSNTGTLRYMAPEVALGCPYGVKCDVHSLAIVMHEVLSLVKPYVNVRPFAFTSVVVKGGLRPTLDPSWPEGVRHLLQGMWSTDCARRPSSEEVVESIEGLLRGNDADLFPKARGLKGFFSDEEPPNRIDGLVSASPAPYTRPRS